MARLNLPAYNEIFHFRLGDVATKRQQLLSLRVLFLCRLGKDIMVPRLEQLISQLVSPIKEAEGLIPSNRVAHPWILGVRQFWAKVPPKEWKQSFLATGEQSEAWCFLYEFGVGLKGEAYWLPSFIASWENVERLMQPADNEMCLFRIADFATKRQQLVTSECCFCVD